MQRLTTASQCQAFRENQCAGKTIALVPTMGALHAGHVALMEAARQWADVVVVSIFVNPLQFGPGEDYERYPRALQADLTQCELARVDAVFTPSVEELYPSGMESTSVILPSPEMAAVACGASRPGHFAGVCTVVAKLLGWVQPNVAVFGEKDAQQLAILRKMVADFGWPIEVKGHPIVREASGLALSSRNQYLTDSLDKQAALLLGRWLVAAHALATQQPGMLAYELYGQSRQQAFSGQTHEVTSRFDVDYITAVEETTFRPVEKITPDTRLLIAARVGQLTDAVQPVRLIDNLHLGQPLPESLSVVAKALTSQPVGAAG